jgi:hypothetical protein
MTRIRGIAEIVRVPFEVMTNFDPVVELSLNEANEQWYPP